MSGLAGKLSLAPGKGMGPPPPGSSRSSSVVDDSDDESVSTHHTKSSWQETLISTKRGLLCDFVTLSLLPPLNKAA